VDAKQEGEEGAACLPARWLHEVEDLGLPRAPAAHHVRLALGERKHHLGRTARSRAAVGSAAGGRVEGEKKVASNGKDAQPTHLTEQTHNAHTSPRGARGATHLVAEGLGLGVPADVELRDGRVAVRLHALLEQLHRVRPVHPAVPVGKGRDVSS
jgi:hypothetical protein